MVVILILPSSSEQTPPPSSSIIGCDQFPLNGARIINNNRHHHHHHAYRNSTSTNRTATPKRIRFQTNPVNHHHAAPDTGAYTATATTTATTSKNFVRHVTRVNISDVFSQIEIDGEAEPVTKEGKSLYAFHTLCFVLFVSTVSIPFFSSFMQFDRLN